jgi:hypothetical protein
LPFEATGSVTDTTGAITDATGATEATGAGAALVRRLAPVSDAVEGVAALVGRLVDMMFDLLVFIPAVDKTDGIFYAKLINLYALYSYSPSSPRLSQWCVK